MGAGTAQVISHKIVNTTWTVPVGVDVLHVVLIGATKATINGVSIMGMTSQPVDLTPACPVYSTPEDIRGELPAMVIDATGTEVHVIFYKF